ncbi:hypothetical protein [Tenacibaculum sp. 190524A02b]|uniref:hypothetical protein n=1 Tax=Tenacibaculum vairaonense TaxID=3137860 RepID=UPI0031FB99E7
MKLTSLNQIEKVNNEELTFINGGQVFYHSCKKNCKIDDNNQPTRPAKKKKVS